MKLVPTIDLLCSAPRFIDALECYTMNIVALQAASSVPQFNFMSAGFGAASASSKMSPAPSLSQTPQKAFSSAAPPASFGVASQLAAPFSGAVLCLAIIRRPDICMLSCATHSILLYHHRHS